MTVDAATWGSKNALKIRLEEEKTQVSQSLTNLGEFLYSKISNLYLKDSSPPFIGEGPVMSLQEAYKGSYARLPCNFSTSSA